MKYALKKQPTPYSNESFDFMNNNMTEYLEYFKDLDTIYGRNYIRLSYFSLDPKKTLKGIERYRRSRSNQSVISSFFL